MAQRYFDPGITQEILSYQPAKVGHYGQGSPPATPLLKGFDCGCQRRSHMIFQKLASAGRGEFCLKKRTAFYLTSSWYSDPYSCFLCNDRVNSGNIKAQITMTARALILRWFMNIVAFATVRKDHMRIMGIQIVCHSGFVRRRIVLVATKTNVRGDNFRRRVFLMTASALDVSRIMSITQQQRLFHHGFYCLRFCYRSRHRSA